MVRCDRYDGHCRNLSDSEIQQRVDEGRPYVVRFVMEKDQNIEFDDMIYGLTGQVITEGVSVQDLNFRMGIYYLT